MASDGMTPEDLAAMAYTLKQGSSTIDHDIAVRLLAELARVTAINDRLIGKMCLVCGAAQPCTATPEACTFDPNPIDVARAFLARARSAEARNVKFTGELGAALAKLDAAEAKLDRVWSALGITTAPVGMDVGEEVEKVKANADAGDAELRNVDAALGNRSAFDECKTRMEKINKMCATAANAKTAEARVAALTEQLQWYASRASDAARYCEKPDTTTGDKLMAIITELSLDAGSRAQKAIHTPSDHR